MNLLISYAMQCGSSFQIYVSRENIVATHSFTGHIVQSHGLNNGGSVVLGHSSSSLAGMAKIVPVPDAPPDSSGSTESYIPVKTIS